MITHIIAQALAYADKTAYAAFLIQTNDSVFARAERHHGAHFLACSALVTDGNGIPSPRVDVNTDRALALICRFIPSLRANLLANPAACTFG